MKRIAVFSLLAGAVTAFGLLYAFNARADADKPVTKVLQVSQTDVDADAIARAMNLQIFAFDLPIPAQECSLNVWTERWTKTATEPEIVGVMAAGVSGEGLGKLTVCLPTTQHPQGIVIWSTSGRKGEVMEPTGTITPDKTTLSSSYKATQLLDQEEFSTSFIQPTALIVGQDIPLMAVQFNKNHSSEGGTEHIEKDNEVTWYVRARFSPGKRPHGNVVWKDGKIVIQ